MKVILFFKSTKISCENHLNSFTFVVLSRLSMYHPFFYKFLFISSLSSGENSRVNNESRCFEFEEKCEVSHFDKIIDETE